MESPCKNNEDVLLQQRHLPHDVIAHNILARLPIKYVVRFKSVSKQWYSTISSSQFRITYLKSSYPSHIESLLIQTNDKIEFLSYEHGEMSLVNMEVDFDIGDETLVLVGSSNGLVCLGSTSGHLFIIWNPITREFRKYLDDSNICDFTSTECMVVWGFGYVVAVDDYKVIRICKKVSHVTIRVHVFSLRSKKWRRIDNDNCSHNFSDLRLANRLYRHGVLINETLYWMCDVPFVIDGLERKVFSFDLALELFDTYPHLDVSTPLTWFTRDRNECFDEFLCVIKGCLSKYGRKRGGVITILKHPKKTEQIHVSLDLVDSSCDKLIGFNGSDMFFTQYFSSRVGAPRLGIIDPCSRPMKHVPLMTFKRGSKIEIDYYEFIRALSVECAKHLHFPQRSRYNQGLYKHLHDMRVVNTSVLACPYVGLDED